MDQEGGPVDRFRDLFGRSISFRDAARAGLAREAGALAGEACRVLGFDVDLAPVVDRELPGASERVLAGRCAAGDPAEIVAAATAFLDGLHADGVGGCVKHFPGLGRADLDTHQALPFLPDDPEEEARDLAPFAATMDLAGAVMISHAAGPDGSARQPSRREGDGASPRHAGIPRRRLLRRPRDGRARRVRRAFPTAAAEAPAPDATFSSSAAGSTSTPTASSASSTRSPGPARARRPPGSGATRRLPREAERADPGVRRPSKRRDPAELRDLGVPERIARFGDQPRHLPLPARREEPVEGAGPLTLRRPL